jgi:carboxylesterase type B
VERSDFIINALTEGEMCEQLDPRGPSSEDCLKLNVYTANTNGKKPVLVFIHGGSFFMGSGSYDYHAGPENLMDHDVVFVAINYRLGLFGFLATGTADAPGNAGLKDQVLALKWVRENIEDFGGDPDCVTIMGNSAGGMSVSLHLVSPMSKGLFHRAIVMSGAATSLWTIPTHQLPLARKHAEILGCKNATITEMMECFYNVESSANQKILDHYLDNGVIQTLIWLPVIEPDFGQERFLVDDPVKLFQSGDFHKVPVMAGRTDLEMIALANMILNNTHELGRFGKDFHEAASYWCMYDSDTPHSSHISTELQKAYFKNKPIDEISLEQISRVCLLLWFEKSYGTNRIFFQKLI